MPLVELLFAPHRVDISFVLELRDLMPGIVSRQLQSIDPSHVVSPTMVDVRVISASPHDRLMHPLYVTIFARTEPDRRHGHDGFVERVTDELRRAGIPDDTMVESILTDRASSYRYRSD